MTDKEKIELLEKENKLLMDLLKYKDWLRGGYFCKYAIDCPVRQAMLQAERKEKEQQEKEN